MHFVYHLFDGDTLMYVGRTVNPTQRLGDHRRRHGIEFRQVIVLTTDDFDTAARREITDIAAHMPPLNLSIQSMRGRLGMPSPEHVKRAISAANTGLVRSDETKQRISDSLSGRTQSDETRMKRSETLKALGHEPTDEARAKSVASRTGSKASEETKAKMRAAWEKRKARGEVNAFAGKAHSEETKAKMRAAWAARKAAGWTHSDETRQKIGEASKNRHIPY